MKKFLTFIFLICMVSCNSTVTREDYTNTLNTTFENVESFINNNKDDINEFIEGYEYCDSLGKEIYNITKEEFVPRLDSLIKTIKNK